MTDRFKFKYLYQDKLREVVDLDFENEYITVRTSIYETVTTGLELEKLKQCTGLRDKTGKLVYFGDLVKNKWGQICKVIMQTDKQNYGRVILQNVKYLNDEAHKNNIFIPAAINESEVIGNIYENPELLEGKCNWI